MKQLFLAALVVLSISNSYAQVSKDPRVGRPDPKDAKQTEFKDELVKGESPAEHRAQAMPGNHQDLNKGNGVTTGVNCTSADGKVLKPDHKQYTKCVDNANRIK